MSVIHIIGIIITVIGIIWLLANFWNNMVYNTKKFVKSEALITRLGVRPMNGAARRTVNGNEFVTNPEDIPLNGDPDARYLPIVQYAYQVNGIAYTSDRLVFQGKRSYTAGETRAMLSQLTLGQRATFFYNPSRPSEAYLFVGRFNYGSYAAPVVIIIVGIIVLLLSQSSQKKKASKEEALMRDIPDVSLTAVDTPVGRPSRYRALA